METVKIVFTEFGPKITMRFTGARIREKIDEALKSDRKVIFCFTGVETISESFADECFGKLIPTFSSGFIQEKTSYEDTNPFIQNAIRKALVERIRKESE